MIMRVNALMMDSTDNVVTCISDIEVGQIVYYKVDDEIRRIIANEHIPYCHKIAINPIKKGEMVVKYGEIIGRACNNIAEGYWVSHLNIESVPRDYTNEVM